MVERSAVVALRHGALTPAARRNWPERTARPEAVSTTRKRLPVICRAVATIATFASVGRLGPRVRISSGGAGAAAEAVVAVVAVATAAAKRGRRQPSLIPGASHLATRLAEALALRPPWSGV